MKLLSVERIEVAESCLEALVRVLDFERMRTSTQPDLPRRAFALLPGLTRHSCENDDGLRMAEEIADTETPHLLEHVTVELMALSGSPRSLKARTTWDFARDGRGVFRLTFDFDDDLVALGALKEAVGIVEWLMVPSPPEPPPDPEAIALRLRALREAPG